MEYPEPERTVESAVDTSVSAPVPVGDEAIEDGDGGVVGEDADVVAKPPRPRKIETRKPTLADALNEAFYDLQELAGEIREWADNMEESFSSTSKYDAVNQAAEDLEGLEELGPEGFGDLEVEVTTVLPRKKNRGLSRADRCGNACNILDACEAALEALDGNNDAMELAGQIRDAKEAAECVDFPGMFG